MNSQKPVAVLLILLGLVLTFDLVPDLRLQTFWPPSTDRAVIFQWQVSGSRVWYHDRTLNKTVSKVLTAEMGIDQARKSYATHAMLIVYPPDVGFPYGVTNISVVKSDVEKWTGAGFGVFIAPYMPNIGEFNLQKIQTIIETYLNELPKISGISPTGLGVRGGASPTQEENHRYIKLGVDLCKAKGKRFAISFGDWQSNADAEMLASYGGDTFIVWAPLTQYPDNPAAVLWKPYTWKVPNIWVEHWVYNNPVQTLYWYDSVWYGTGWGNPSYWNNVKGIVLWNTVVNHILSQEQLDAFATISKDFRGIEKMPDPQAGQYPLFQPKHEDNFDSYNVGDFPSGWEAKNPTVNGYKVDNTKYVSPPNSLKMTGPDYTKTLLEPFERGDVRITAAMHGTQPGAKLSLRAWGYSLTFRGKESWETGPDYWILQINKGQDVFAELRLNGTWNNWVYLRMEVRLFGSYPRQYVEVKGWIKRVGEEFTAVPQLVAYRRDYSSDLKRQILWGKCGVAISASNNHGGWVDGALTIESLVPTAPPESPPPEKPPSEGHGGGTTQHLLGIALIILGAGLLVWRREIRRAKGREEKFGEHISGFNIILTLAAFTTLMKC